MSSLAGTETPFRKQSGRMFMLARKAMEFRAELLRVLDPTRAEAGCLAIQIFESLREPFVCAIHSEARGQALLNG
jgi:quinol monooxygenase YgiN